MLFLLVDINNNIIEPEMMLVDENNNLINLPDANFDLNNNYLWNNNNNQDNVDQQQRPQQDNQPQQQQQGRQNDHQSNSSQQQNPPSNNSNGERTSQHLSILKDKLNCNKSNCTNCKSTPTTSTNNSPQSVQIRQRKKLLELDLNKPRTSSQFYSPMNDEENVIKEEECSTNNSSTHSMAGNHYHVFKRSASSGRRKKSIQCKKCMTKHLTKCDHNKCEHNRCEFKNENSKCEHYHSIDSTPEAINESKKINNSFLKTKASTPITENAVVDNAVVETVVDALQQANKSSVNNLLEQTNSTSLASAQQCPICLSLTINEPCKPNNCSHSFCQICVLEWAKVSNECPLCREPFTALLNKNNLPLECSINLQSDRDLNLIELSQSVPENILNLDDLNWPIIASSFLNQTSQGNVIDQQCEQINSILNSVFGHLEPQNMDFLQWPF